jgi:hypothetical protein
MRAVGAAACIAVLALTAGAFAAREAGGAIDPGTPVNGMVVMQGLAQDADVPLFGYYCAPNVMSPGRHVRVCAALPRSAGYSSGMGTGTSPSGTLSRIGVPTRIGPRCGSTARVFVWTGSGTATAGSSDIPRLTAGMHSFASGRSFFSGLKDATPFDTGNLWEGGFADTTWRFTVGGS